MSKGLVDFMQQSKAEVFCLQETKANAEQITDDYLFDAIDFKYRFWFSAEKKGYSGVAIFSKVEPKNITYGFGDPGYDAEGRIIRADFNDFSVISVYIPSGSSGEDRQQYKMKWLDYFHVYIEKIRTKIPNLIICGDFNIVHKPIDIHDPVSNKNSSGFLPEEREWLTKFIDNGFTDSFRAFNTEPHQYSWWTYRAGARGKNKGWRIDYCMVAQPLTNKLVDAGIMQQIVHSDHCPVWVEVKG